jgi:diamine N-acetyltransferase
MPEAEAANLHQDAAVRVWTCWGASDSLAVWITVLADSRGRFKPARSVHSGVVFTIRRADATDAARVAAFAARTFRETFGQDNSVEDMSLYLESAYSVEKQTAELSSPDILTLLAEQHGATIGFAMLRRNGPMPACVTMPDPIELWRFYVDRAWHGRGVAPVLMDAVLDAARSLGSRSIWLGVWEQNARAIAFYTKHAFVDVGTHEFMVGSDRQTDRVLVGSLEPEHVVDAVVRVATDADLPALGRLGALLVRQHTAFDRRRFIAPANPESLYEDFLRTEMRSDDVVVLVAERGGLIVGYAFASFEPPSMKELRATAGFIHDVLVEEAARRASIGTALVNAAIAWLRDHGADRVMLWSAEQNVGAQQLFTRLGFRRTMVEMTRELT